MWQVRERPLVEVCRRRGLKVNAGKRKLIVLGGEEGLWSGVCIDGMPLLVGEGLQVLLALRLMLEVCSLSVLGTCVSYCSFLFLCMVVRQWKEKDRFKIKAVQVDNLRSMLGINKTDKVLNAQIREFCD